MAFNVDQAYFVAFAVEAMLWGGYCLLFFTTVKILFRCRIRNKILVATMIALFVLCTTHYSVVFANVYQGLMVKHFAIGDEDHMLVGADLLNFIIDWLGQSILIYRCWFVWNKRFSVILLPLLMSFTSLSCGISTLALTLKFTNALPTNGAGQGQTISNLVYIATGVPIGTNILLTGLITGRIWYISHRATEYLHSGGIPNAIAVIFESGALVTVTQLVLSALVLNGHPAQNILFSTAAQVYGIAPTIILLRVGLGTSIDTTIYGMTTVKFAEQEKVTVDVERNDDVDASLDPSATRTSFSANNFKTEV